MFHEFLDECGDHKMGEDSVSETIELDQRHREHPGSTSNGPDQHRRISVKDDLGSTSWINGRDGRVGQDGVFRLSLKVSFGCLYRLSFGVSLGFLRA
jgi:hypothetical protein